MSKSSLEEKLKRYGQEHLLRFWDELTEDEQQTFADELNNINFEKVQHLSSTALDDLNNPQTKKDEYMEPLPDDIVGRISDSSPQQLEEWYNEGLKQISEGTVAVCLLAGGQGTRLGVSYPKGMYDVGLPSNKTLYQLQAERIKKVQELASERFGREACVKWYIMTSDATLKDTKLFFTKHDYFGLKSTNVIFFEQNRLPCLTFDGKMILNGRGSVALSPDGNGGLYDALVSRGVVDMLTKDGVEHIYVYCVDNILVKVADPTFIGFCVKKNLECGNKVIKKVDPHESVGVVCKCRDKYQIVEYSEICTQTAEKRNEDGSLVFNASNMCIHYFSKQFLDTVCTHHLQHLPHHIAKKKIPHLSVGGDLVIPTSPNGMKLEKFVFDVFPHASRFGVLEGEREHEFSPLKNGPDAGKFCPSTCRSDLLSLHREYLNNAGCVVSDDNNACEVSPLVSYQGEGLEAYKGNNMSAPTVHLER
jgi:UDP-N-acetylglucosamine/UDP-N-acetylgalactosamine diphosphorylase